MFLQSLNGSPTPHVTFISQQTRSTTNRGCQQNFCGGGRGNMNAGKGRGGCQPPYCQLCQTNGHYASSCPNLHTYVSNA